MAARGSSEKLKFARSSPDMSSLYSDGAAVAAYEMSQQVFLPFLHHALGIPSELKRAPSKLENEEFSGDSHQYLSALGARNFGVVGAGTIDLDMALKAEYTIHHRAGDGAASEVFFGVKKDTGEYVVIKRIPREKIMGRKEYKLISHESIILEKLHHPNIIGMVDVIPTPTHLNLVLEYAIGTELASEIVARKTFTEHDVQKITKELLHGMAYIHRQGIVHGDVKPENIICSFDDHHLKFGATETRSGYFKDTLDSEMSLVASQSSSASSSSMKMCRENSGVRELKSLKLIDFGLARFAEDSSAAKNTGGTMAFNAPELLEGGQVTAESDMWAVGVPCFILLGGYPPFFSDPDRRTVADIVNSPYYAFINECSQALRDQIIDADPAFVSPFWDDVSGLAQDFVQCLLCRHPEDRLTAEQALQHPWITNPVDYVPRARVDVPPDEDYDDNVNEGEGEDALPL